MTDTPQFQKRLEQSCSRLTRGFFHCRCLELPPCVTAMCDRPMIKSNLNEV